MLVPLYFGLKLIWIFYEAKFYFSDTCFLPFLQCFGFERHLPIENYDFYFGNFALFFLSSEHDLIFWTSLKLDISMLQITFTRMNEILDEAHGPNNRVNTNLENLSRHQTLNSILCLRIMSSHIVHKLGFVSDQKAICYVNIQLKNMLFEM